MNSVWACEADYRYSEYGPVGAEANFISSQLFGELAVQATLADWLWKYQNVSWGNEFQIQDTVSLDLTLWKTALYERTVLQFHSQDTKRKLW